MASLLSRFFGSHDNRGDSRWDAPSAPILPTRDTRPAPAPPESDSSTLPPLKNWCHPFKDKRDPLAQLTHMANAAAGYYPLGRSGLFHGGVHFDGGTAGLLDQSSVHCLADGEVVAYRVDTRSPTTYFVNAITVEKPFSRNFVLVRHRLQPPKIQGSQDIPPSLIFYSLYMHLQDWETYQKTTSIARPAFWPQSPTLRVKQAANDARPGQPNQPGLNVRHSERHGKVIDLLPRGAEVTVSGTGHYRKLENRPGPTKLINADGSLAGYIHTSILQLIAGNQYRITSSKELINVRAEPKVPCPILLELPTGTIVTVSGEGEFRKLERVDQYVYFDLLERAQEPLAVDRIVVLDQPVPIKAGHLIGHLGKYQDCRTEQPEHKLHLEVLSGDDVDLFLENSRTWARRLPDEHKTWLKLAKGTPVVLHEANVTAGLLKVMSVDSPVSAADLLVPKSLLDGLPAKDKMVVPATDVHKARNWYRLDGLLHDANNNLLDGWVCEEVGVTPWLSPWSWEGYDVIFDYDLPKHAMASFFSSLNRFSDVQRERFQPWAEKDNNGPMKSQLYDIIDRDRVGKMTAEELQAALRLPALAQAISQMILRKESEWFYQTPKWDALDELLGHSGSTPHLNWLAEKQRIEQMSWWGEVAEKVGLPSWGRPYHFHPIGLITHLSNHQKKCYCYQQGLVDNPCDAGVTDVTKKHFELLADELGVEREVLRAIAVAETGDKAPFREYEIGKRHALILYERHYMRRLLLASGMSQSEINALSMSEPKIVHAYEASYVYGSLDEQYSRLKRAREINHAAAIKSCSWGKFQVMGEYYRHLYSSIEELEEAQNYCALQHLQYFKVFLVKEKKLMGPMKNKDWLLIAQKYNGKGQIGYDVKIRSAYDSLKQNW